MWLEPLDQTATVLEALSVTVAGGFAALIMLRFRRGTESERMKRCLENHQDYFTYISANIDGADALLPPPGTLNPAELRAIQSKLLEWIETIGGEYRHKLTALCRDLGLVELELRRIRSQKHGTRIEAAYRLGVMRASECFEELLKLLEREGTESTAFVVGRAAAKCAGSHEELRRLLVLLTGSHPEAHQLIADIAASSSLDPAPLYADLICEERSEPLIAVALTGLSGRSLQEAFGPLERLLSSEHKDIRIKAAKLLLQYSHLIPIERIGELIGHPDWEIRAAAVKSVGELRLDYYLKALTRSMADKEWWVRYYSAKSLAQLGPAGFEALCEAACGAGSAVSRESALEAAHEELDRAEASAAQDATQIPHFNRLNMIYRRFVGEAGTDRLAERTRISS